MDEVEKKEQEQGAAQEPSAVLEKVLKERDEYLSGWQRAKADFANYKKDEMVRLERAVLFAGEELIKELVRVMDSFDLALAAMEKQGHVEKGVYMIRTQLADVVKKFGLTALVVSVGDEFSPKVAEAIAMEDSELPEGTITEIIETGYSFHEKILRPARVKISKGPSAK